MSDSDISVMASHDTIALVNQPTPASRISEWTCRLPEEVFRKILATLAKNKKYRSLRSMQSTSSTVYLAVTAYLYQHLDLDHRSIPRLFGLFRGIVQKPLAGTE
jgi:hypothetical protein